MVTWADNLRAPVQPSKRHNKPAGTIGWAEHAEAWRAYDKKWRTNQSAERIAERGGFGYGELVEFLGREPTTWKAR
jgi:hypothetical protein